MFEQLMPLLAERMLIVTLSRVSDEQICVNIIPKPLKATGSDDDKILATPLAATGTPKELDEQLPRLLLEFVETHLELSSTLRRAKEEMEAAAKTAREAARKSTSTKGSATRGPVGNHGANKNSSAESGTCAEPDVENRIDNDLLSGAGSTGNLFERETKNESCS